jgi:Sec-independent protein translocase protein TatA
MSSSENDDQSQRRSQQLLPCLIDDVIKDEVFDSAENRKSCDFDDDNVSVDSLGIFESEAGRDLLKELRDSKKDVRELEQQEEQHQAEKEEEMDSQHRTKLVLELPATEFMTSMASHRISAFDSGSENNENEARHF